MDRNNNFWLILVILFGILLLGYGILFAKTDQQILYQNVSISSPVLSVEDSHRTVNTENVANYEPDMVTVDTNATMRENLYGYVYKYSKNISRDMAKRIVDSVMQTEQPALLLALMRRESNYNPTAISSANCIGLGQIHPKFWTKELQGKGIITETRDLYNIENNVAATAYIFMKLWNKSHGNLETALTKYYGGPHSSYVKNIMTTYFELKWIMESV